MLIQRADIVWILEKYEENGGCSDDFLLIGGGASTHWYFALSQMDEEAEEPEQFQTRDIDLHVRTNNSLGAVRQRVELLASSIGATTRYPEFGESTPEYARLVIPGHFDTGEDLEIDLMKSPHGLSAKEIEDHAEQLFGDPTSDGQPGRAFPVLHPVHVVLGLCMSYLELPSKRDAVTLQRIEALLPIVRRYLIGQAEYAQSPGAAAELERRQVLKEARWGIQKLMKESARPQFASFYLDHDVDLTKAVPTEYEAPLNPEFWHREFPALVRRVKERREAARNRRACNLSRCRQ